MEKQTLLFLEALWNANVQREILRDLGEDSAVADFERRFRGVLHSDTIWVSDQAQDIRYQLLQIQDKIHGYTRLNQLSQYVDDYLKLQGQVQALQIQTAQTLGNESVVDIHKVHIISFPMFKMAANRIKEAACLELYRFLILNGSIPSVLEEKIPYTDELEPWLGYYQKYLSPLSEQLPDNIVDGRWAYEKKNLVLAGNIVLEQFVSVPPVRDEIGQMPGTAKLSMGSEGDVRITGRGYITNLIPDDILQIRNIQYYGTIRRLKYYSFIKNEDVEPTEILKRLFRGKLYLISSQDYFAMINKYLMIKTFSDREHRGRCICCGNLMEKGFCQTCDPL